MIRLSLSNLFAGLTPGDTADAPAAQDADGTLFARLLGRLRGPGGSGRTDVQGENPAAAAALATEAPTVEGLGVEPTIPLFRLRTGSHPKSLTLSQAIEEKGPSTSQAGPGSDARSDEAIDALTLEPGGSSPLPSGQTTPEAGDADPPAPNLPAPPEVSQIPSGSAAPQPVQVGGHGPAQDAESADSILRPPGTERTELVKGTGQEAGSDRGAAGGTGALGAPGATDALGATGTLGAADASGATGADGAADASGATGANGAADAPVATGESSADDGANGSNPPAAHGDRIAVGRVEIAPEGAVRPPTSSREGMSRDLAPHSHKNAEKLAATDHLAAKNQLEETLASRETTPAARQDTESDASRDPASRATDVGAPDPDLPEGSGKRVDGAAARKDPRTQTEAEGRIGAEDGSRTAPGTANRRETSAHRATDALDSALPARDNAPPGDSVAAPPGTADESGGRESRPSPAPTAEAVSRNSDAAADNAVNSEATRQAATAEAESTTADKVPRAGAETPATRAGGTPVPEMGGMRVEVVGQTNPGGSSASGDPVPFSVSAALGSESQAPGTDGAQREIRGTDTIGTPVPARTGRTVNTDTEPALNETPPKADGQTPPGTTDKPPAGSGAPVLSPAMESRADNQSPATPPRSTDAGRTEEVVSRAIASSGTHLIDPADGRSAELAPPEARTAESPTPDGRVAEPPPPEARTAESTTPDGRVAEPPPPEARTAESTTPDGRVAEPPPPEARTAESTTPDGRVAEPPPPTGPAIDHEDSIPQFAREDAGSPIADALQGHRERTAPRSSRRRVLRADTVRSEPQGASPVDSRSAAPTPGAAATQAASQTAAQPDPAAGRFTVVSPGPGGSTPNRADASDGSTHSPVAGVEGTSPKSSRGQEKESGGQGGAGSGTAEAHKTTSKDGAAGVEREIQDFEMDPMQESSEVRTPEDSLEPTEAALLEYLDDFLRPGSEVRGGPRPIGAALSPASTRGMLTAAWLRAMRAEHPSAPQTSGGWHEVQMRLDDDQGAMRIRARRIDERVSVHVQVSDPKLQNQLNQSLDRIQNSLQERYGADVDLSFEQGHGTNDSSQGDPQARRRFAPSAHREPGIHTAQNRPGRRLGAANVWVG